jgi:hypothetical protein
VQHLSEAIQENKSVSGIFVDGEGDKLSLIDQVSAVRISPDDEHIYFKNQLPESSRHSVFHFKSNIEFLSLLYCFRVNETDCYGTKLSVCFYLKD